MQPLRSLALAVLFVALAACQREAAAPADSAATNAAGSAATAAPAKTESAPTAATTDEQAAAFDLGEFRIVSVLVGNAVDADKVVTADKPVLSGSDSIYASVLSTGAHQGLRVSARWLAPDGSTIVESVEPVVPTSATATTFNIRNPEPWPAGEYQVQIGVDGHTLSTKKFEVR